MGKSHIVFSGGILCGLPGCAAAAPLLSPPQEYSERVLILEQSRVVSHQDLSGWLNESRPEQRHLRVVLSWPCGGLPEWL